MSADATSNNGETSVDGTIFDHIKRMLSELELPANGFDVSLTGRQIHYVRNKLGESQLVFARRLGVSQGTVFRLERHGDKPATGPDVILISLIALQNRIELPTEFPDELNDNFAEGELSGEEGEDALVEGA